jgi:EmrB/QacA subfamily drug resistance transporter
MMEALPPIEGAPTPSLADDPALGLSQRAKLEILGAVMLGLFLGALDQTIVGTALPKIVTQLGGNDLYTWVVTIYLLTSTITIPFYGKLSDVYGRRPMLMIGIGLFLVGSALSGLSQNMTELILFRGIQGLGAGALFPISLAVIGDLFTPAERGKYQGLFGAVFGIAFIVGPFLGGFLTDNVTWHAIFYVNVPIGLISLYVIWRLLPTVKTQNATRNFDIAGALVFTAAIGLLLVGLTNEETGSWTDPSVGGFIAAGLLLGALFVFIESRAKEPIVPLDLWKNRTYTSSMIATFLVSFGFYGALIFLPRWFQVIRGDSATFSGYELLPLLAGLIGSSIISGFIVSRTGRYKNLILISLAIIVVGMIVMAQITTDVSVWVIYLGMFIAGVGIGPAISVYTIIIQNAVPFSRLGVATSNLTFFRQIGGSVGLAIAGTIFSNALSTELPKQLGPVIGKITAAAPPAVQPQIGQIFQQAGSQNLNNLTGVGQSFGQVIISSVPQALQAVFEPFKAQLDLAFNNSFSFGVSQTFLLGVAASIAAVVFSFAMKDIPLRKTLGAEPAAKAADAKAPATGPAVGVPAASTIRADISPATAAVGRTEPRRQP